MNEEIKNIYDNSNGDEELSKEFSIDNKNNEKKESKLQIGWGYLKVIIFAFVISFVVKTYIFSSTLVDGNSMYPTVHHKDKLIVNKIFFMKSKITRGDIIDFYVPSANKFYLKRVIAVEGDTVEIKENRVYVNGEKLKEDYVSTEITEPHTEITKWKVTEGKVFVLGDNRSNSTDSRDLGLISRKDIVGKIVLRYYPVKRFGGLD